jgi:hypothetical protein
MQPANISSAAAVYPCTGIEVKSNLPTTWTITGPGGVSVVNPSGPAASTGFATNKSSTGGIIPQGEYTIQVQPTVPGGRNPRFAWNIGSDSEMIGGSATFTCLGIWSHLTVNYRGVTESGEVLQFQRTPLDFDNFIGSRDRGVLATQDIGSGAVVGSHFVFRGDWCRGDMHSGLGGSGLWSVSEDGTKVQERQQCIDAGSETNNPASISYNLNAGMESNDNSDFLFTGSDIRKARRTVYYGFSGDEVVIKSRSPLSFHELFFTGYNGEGTPSLANGYVVDSKDGSTFRLSDWENVGISPVKSFFSLGDYLIGRADARLVSSPLHVYKMQNGQVSDVGELPGNVRVTLVGHTYDFSKSPTQLVIYDGGLQASGQHTPPRLIWYKVGSSGLELVKEMSLSSDFSETNGYPGRFAVWGDYLIRYPILSDKGTIIGKATGSTFTKVQTVLLPNGGNPSVILASSGGYVAIAAYNAQGTPSAQNSTGWRSQVHIYKFGGASTSTPSVPPFPPAPSSSSTLSQIPGQTLTINTSVTPATILARMANVLSVSSTSLSIEILGHIYTVDASKAKIYTMNWTLIPLSSFSAGSYVNVWGTLDPTNPSLIHAVNIRSSLPATLSAGTSQATSFVAPAQSAASTGDTQRQLNTLQEMLRALQLRLAQ